MEEKRVQVIVFKQEDKSLSFLLLKRNERDGGFWQFVTGTPDTGEDDQKALRRELREETGITEDQFLKLYGCFYNFSWEKSGVPIKESVYALEVDSTIKIVLSEEHDDYKWADKAECKSLFKHASSIEALDMLLRMLKKDKDQVTFPLEK